MLSPYQAACCPPEPVTVHVPQGTPVHIQFYPWQRRPMSLKETVDAVIAAAIPPQPTSQELTIMELMAPSAPPRPNWLPPYCVWRVPKEGEYYYIQAPRKSTVRRAGAMYVHSWWVVVPPKRPSCVPDYAVWKIPLSGEEYHCFKQPQVTTTGQYTAPLGGCFRWTIVPPPMPAAVERYTKRNGLVALWRCPKEGDVIWNQFHSKWYPAYGLTYYHHWVLVAEGRDPLAHQDLPSIDPEM